MSRLQHIGIFEIIFISVVLCQDRIIVSSPNSDEFHNISSPENDTVIPETLLIQLKDVRNLTDLFQQFFVFEEDEFMLASRRDGNTSSSRRGLSAVAASVVAQPANCQIEEHIIELDKPENGATLYWPSCVRVKRCGGCCTSKLLTCKPLAISTLNVTVLQMHYSLENPGKFESQGTKVFAVEQHNRCACTCKESEDDCDPSIHEYRSNECRCVCKNSELSALCNGPKKIWDSRNCICKCRKIRMCSSGRYFNILTCKCEILRRSLGVDTLMVQNSNSSLQVSAASPRQ